METNKTTPPFSLTRNGSGLLDNVNYIYSIDGTIDYRKMVPKEFLVPNALTTTETDITKLTDKDILIVLKGIRWLANLRGFSSVKFSDIIASTEYVLTKCQITFIANYETNNSQIVFESLGDASIGNTRGFGKNFLSACAENRAFSRCVRNFLNLGIVSEEEIESANPIQNNTNADSPAIVLKQLMDQQSYTFEKIKDKLVNDNIENAKNWQKIEDIPNSVIFDIIKRINKKKKKEEVKT